MGTPDTSTSARRHATNGCIWPLPIPSCRIGSDFHPTAGMSSRKAQIRENAPRRSGSVGRNATILPSAFARTVTSSRRTPVERGTESSFLGAPWGLEMSPSTRSSVPLQRSFAGCFLCLAGSETCGSARDDFQTAMALGGRLKGCLAHQPTNVKRHLLVTTGTIGQRKGGCTGQGAAYGSSMPRLRDNRFEPTAPTICYTPRLAWACFENQPSSKDAVRVPPAPGHRIAEHLAVTAQVLQATRSVPTILGASRPQQSRCRQCRV